MEIDKNIYKWFLECDKCGSPAFYLKKKLQPLDVLEARFIIMPDATFLEGGTRAWCGSCGDYPVISLYMVKDNK